MSASNYPPGMSQRDYDHVNGVTRCEECGADISIEWENGEVDDDNVVCPGGCAEKDWDAERDMREGF